MGGEEGSSLLVLMGWAVRPLKLVLSPSNAKLKKITLVPDGDQLGLGGDHA